MLRSSLRRFGTPLAAVSLVAAAALGGAPAAHAATQSVTIGDGFFEPAALTVTAGDTVTWTNADGSPHTATANGGGFDSGNLDPGATFSFTFSEPGTYTYVCRYHDEMVATVMVVPAASAPTVSGAAQQPAGAAEPPAGTAPPPAGASTGAADAAAGQPNTALPLPSDAAEPLAAVLIGLGLVAFAFALFPPHQPVAPAPGRRRGGWRR